MFRGMQSAETLSEAVYLLERMVDYWVAAGGKINRRLLSALSLSGRMFKTDSRQAASALIERGLAAVEESQDPFEQTIACLVEFRRDNATGDDVVGVHDEETGGHVINMINTCLSRAQYIESCALHDGTCGARSEHEICAEMVRQMNIGVTVEAVGSADGLPPQLID